MAYIYRHIRLDKNEPFYIGIGSDDTYSRANSEKDRNKHWKNIKNLTKIKVDILLENITWEEACIKEKEFISLYGRSDINKGTLCNLTDGGEGFVGLIKTEEIREKISKNNAKFWLGKKRPELAEKTIRMNKERIWTKEQRENHSKTRLGEKGSMYGRFGKDCPNSKSILCITTGIIYEGASDAANKLGLNIGHIASTARGLLKSTGHRKYPGGLEFKYLIN
jgi:hypothetical protein